MTRIFIVGGSQENRRGVESLLGPKGVAVVGSAATLASLGAALSDEEVDVLLVDATGEAPERLLDSVAGWTSDLPVVLLAEDLPVSLASAAVRAGVRGVLPSDLKPNQLVAALKAVASGLLVLDPAVAAVAVPASAPAPRAPAELAEPLTRREREVLEMLAAGLGNKQIADRLIISEHTVKFHVASILGKLGAGSRTEAVSLGIRHGLVLL